MRVKPFPRHCQGLHLGYGLARWGATWTGFSRHCMNCLSNCESCSGAGGALGGVAARRAWNSLIAGFCAAAPECGNASLIDWAKLANVDDGSLSPWRDPGTATTKNSATRAATPMAAAKRAAMVHNAFF